MSKFIPVARFASSSSRRMYTVVVNVDTRVLSCNCKGWTTKRDGQPRSCKHTRAVIVNGGVPVVARGDYQVVA